MDREGAVCYRSTPDIEAGYLRGSLGNVEGYIPESSIEYVDPGMYLDGRPYAKGIWRNNRESLSLDTDEKGDGHIFIEYQGLDVLGVLSSSGSKKLEVVVQQDDRFLTSENKGEDVRLDSEGKSCIEVGDPRLYSIVKNMDYGEHLLHLTAQNVPLTVYAFAFGTSVISEMVSKN